MDSGFTEHQSRIRAHIIDLLSRYKTNQEKLERYREEEIVREAQSVNDYVAAMIPTQKSVSSDSSSCLDLPSLSFLLELEKRQFFSTLERLKIEVQLVKLLLLHLSDEDVTLLTNRYYKSYSISRVCSEMFFSRSTFYRRHEEILNQLVLYYDSIFPHSAQSSSDASLDEG
ncbi:hypothetical protein [Murdochiella vaginalis]|uniref:hypothetical protein n=1 Tax=Murdochiella vaginalis TaxID=1852373 RepID=UPI0008FE6703|nr:hypothetical protein [Murdochiella vaginalis]